ncbi:ATP-binding cassette domain-containing protein [Inhella crocodyli]|uniref:ATP-binding cassette domain-containing protein n=1 Tax=Inhella crocodyli TaxID=2499851 RepID=A0A3S2XPF8_9BURK|nr:ATP-binding cassette domain-containing protein [Inhella crocodyli]RVT83757.1 ATP-binding cassette domain-containing protein [Inhella crocodyli]
MIDLALHTTLRDGPRRFTLDLALRSQAKVLGVYGASGAGKSLALQAIAGLAPVTEGRVVVNGRVWLDTAQRVNQPVPERRVGLLFQHYALFPHLSVRANVAFGLTRWWQRLKPADAARVDALLARFGLSAMAHSRPDRLSGGQRQRVALARALACEPELLLLDEPFAALNPQLRVPLRRELAQTCAEWGVPVVLVTHDVDDLLDLADEAVLIDEGRVLKHVNLRDASPDALAEAGLQPEPDTPERARRRALLA